VQLTERRSARNKRMRDSRIGCFDSVTVATHSRSYEKKITRLQRRGSGHEFQVEHGQPSHAPPDGRCSTCDFLGNTITWRKLLNIKPAVDKNLR